MMKPVFASLMGALTLLCVGLTHPAPARGQERPAVDPEYRLESRSPRLFLTARRLRLLRRERERQSMRWEQFHLLMQGGARMPEPGFAKALYSKVLQDPAPCAEALAWAARTANEADPAELRQVALVYDWCQEASGHAAERASIVTKLTESLDPKPADIRWIRARTLAAVAGFDSAPGRASAYLKFVVETWWRREYAPALLAGDSIFLRREDVFSLVEILHAVRDNLNIDLRDDAAKWFDELPSVLLLAYYPATWPAPENEYRIPVYVGQSEPNLRIAALARAAEMGLTALDANPVSHQFLQGWLMQDRFALKSAFGAPYEFLWANPYQPGLSFHYMPDVYHGFGRLLMRSTWDEDAAWFGYFDGQAQTFENGQRAQVRLARGSKPLTLGVSRILVAETPLKFEAGLLPEPVESGPRKIEEHVFLVGLKPKQRYDVEVDNEEMFEAIADAGGIVELKFPPGRKVAVRIKETRVSAVGLR